MRNLVKLLRVLRPFLGTLWRILRQLFHEVTGVLFLALALVGVLACWREWSLYRRAVEPELFRLIAAGVFALLMFWFGITSFLRAKRLNRTPRAPRDASVANRDG